METLVLVCYIDAIADLADMEKKRIRESSCRWHRESLTRGYGQF